MDPDRARRLLQAKRAEVQGLLAEATAAGRQDWTPSGRPAIPRTRRNRSPTQASTTPWPRRSASGWRPSPAQSSGSTRERSASRSAAGSPPEERLEADPAAELTVEEARSLR